MDPKHPLAFPGGTTAGGYMDVYDDQKPFEHPTAEKAVVYDEKSLDQHQAEENAESFDFCCELCGKGYTTAGGKNGSRLTSLLQLHDSLTTV